MTFASDLWIMHLFSEALVIFLSIKHKDFRVTNFGVPFPDLCGDIVSKLYYFYWHLMVDGLNGLICIQVSCAVLWVSKIAF